MTLAPMSAATVQRVLTKHLAEGADLRRLLLLGSRSGPRLGGPRRAEPLVTEELREEIKPLLPKQEPRPKGERSTGTER